MKGVLIKLGAARKQQPNSKQIPEWLQLKMMESQNEEYHRWERQHNIENKDNTRVAIFRHI